MANKVSINDATRDDLKQARQIDDKMADLIIKYRDEQGPFRSREDVNAIPEVGDELVQNLSGVVSMPSNGSR